MGILDKGIKYITDSSYRWIVNSNLGFYDSMDDEKYIKGKYRANLGFYPDLENPVRFTEKLQWLKLNDRKPEYTMMVDKCLVKNYVEGVIGKEYIIPTIMEWDKAEDIDFDMLPDKFVLKCNHNSGKGMYICKNKASLTEENKKKIVRGLNEGLKENFYLKNREWPYRDVKRKVFAEVYMEDTKTKELRDYKFYCFNGKVGIFKIDLDRFTGHKTNYYDAEGRLLDMYEEDYPQDLSRKDDIPESLSTMVELAEKLAGDIPFVRVDFYEVDGKVLFGEMTFFPYAGFRGLMQANWDNELGALLTLPKKD